VFCSKSCVFSIVYSIYVTVKEKFQKIKEKEMKLYQPHQKGEFWFHKKVSSAWTDLCFVRFENPQREEHCCSFTKNGWNFRFRFDDIGKEFELSRFGIGLLTIMLFQDNTSDQKVLEMVKEEAYRELPRLEVIYDDKHGKTVCLSCEDSNQKYYIDRQLALVIKEYVLEIEY